MPPLHRKSSLTMAAAFCLIWPDLAGAAPTVSNIRCTQVTGTKRVEVRYDVRATGVTAVKVKLEISANAGSSYAVPVATLRGAVGLGVPVGLDRLVMWEAGQEWDQQVSAQMRVRITADDAPPTAEESGMVLIPGGTFMMGDGLARGRWGHGGCCAGAVGTRRRLRSGWPSAAIAAFPIRRSGGI